MRLKYEGEEGLSERKYFLNKIKNKNLKKKIKKTYKQKTAIETNYPNLEDNTCLAEQLEGESLKDIVLDLYFCSEGYYFTNDRLKRIKVCD